MKPKLLNMWIDVVYAVARLSTCDRTQVGCLLLSLDGERLLSFGYNGGPRGGPNVPPEGDHPGTDFWVHAEINALVKTRPVEPFVVLTTHTPCDRCASAIINAQAWAVLSVTPYRRQAGWDLIKAHYAYQGMRQTTAFAHGVPRCCTLLELP